jgi:hypothetical protein
MWCLVGERANARAVERPARPAPTMMICMLVVLRLGVV